MMWLVTIEDEFGMWFDDPEAFNSMKEAEDHASSLKGIVQGHVIVIYKCDAVKTIDRYEVG